MLSDISQDLFASTSSSLASYHITMVQGQVEYEGLSAAASRPARKSWWYVAGAGVASLAVVGLAKAVFPSSLTFGKTSGVMSLQEV